MNDGIKVDMVNDAKSSSDLNLKRDLEDDEILLKDFECAVTKLIELCSELKKELDLPDPIHVDSKKKVASYYWNEWHEVRRRVDDYVWNRRDLNERMQWVKRVVDDLKRLDYYLEFQVPIYGKEDPNDVVFVEDNPRNAIELTLKTVRFVGGVVDIIFPQRCLALEYGKSENDISVESNKICIAENARSTDIKFEPSGNRSTSHLMDKINRLCIRRREILIVLGSVSCEMKKNQAVNQVRTKGFERISKRCFELDFESLVKLSLILKGSKKGWYVVYDDVRDLVKFKMIQSKSTAIK